MWLNPLKGAHLTLGQLDKTLPVDLSAVKEIDGANVEINKQIERGSIVFISTGETQNGTPRFALYTADQAGKPNAVPYVALMGVKDFQAGMAGNVGQAPEVDSSAGADKGKAAAGGVATWLRTPPPGADGIVGVTSGSGIRGPRITAVSLVQPAEWETDAFEPESSEIIYYVGCPLTVSNNGKLTPWATGKNIVGYVTAIPKPRWINDLGASADGARISGGNKKVIAFSTAWIPVAGKADAADSAPAPVKVDMLGLKGGAKADAPADAGAKADAKDGAPAGAKADNTKTK